MRRLKEPNDARIYSRVLLQARPYWGHIALISILSLLSTPLTLLGPVPLALAVDSVLGDEPLPEFMGWVPESIATSDASLLALLAFMVIAIALLNQVLDFLTALLRRYTGEGLVMDWRSSLFRHSQRLSQPTRTWGTGNSNRTHWC